MNETTQTDSELPQSGSRPLTNFKHEIYARERSLGVAPERAAQRAGYAPRCAITLRQEGDPLPSGSYCEWMPYQKAVAKGEIAPTLHAAGAPHISTKSTELDSH